MASGIHCSTVEQQQPVDFISSPPAGSSQTDIFVDGESEPQTANGNCQSLLPSEPSSVEPLADSTKVSCTAGAFLTLPATQRNPISDPLTGAIYTHDSQAPSLYGQDWSLPTTPSPPESIYSPPATCDSFSKLDDCAALQPDSSITNSSNLGGPRLPGHITRRAGAYRTSRVPSWRRFKEKVDGQLNLRAIIQIFDFRPWFWPFTWKKYTVLFIICCVIAGIIVSDHYTHWLSKSLKITRTFMLPVLIISVCAEPLIILTILPVAQMPDIPRHEVEANLNLKSSEETGLGEKPRELQGPFETALVTPCHNSDFRTTKIVIDSALLRFRPQDLFIVDNGNSKYPQHPDGNFRAYIRSLHPDINYIWSPIGSKNAAQMIGAMAARDRGYKYVMTADDDVCIPKNFVAPTDLIDAKFKAVAYPLKAVNRDLESSLWLVAWQDVEYRLSSTAKLCEDRLCGVQFPHGAGWFVEINAFIELMEKYHPMDFIAEDCHCGLGFSKMKKGIRIDARSFLATEVPTTFFGPGLNWWKQRQKSWEMGRHGLLLPFAREFLFSLPAKRTVQGIFWHKISYLYYICSNLIDWLRIPIFVALGRSW